MFRICARFRTCLAVAALGSILVPLTASPSSAADMAHLNGAELGIVWGLPFVGMLLSIALFPLLAPKVWEHHFGKISMIWTIVLAVPLIAVHGTTIAATELLHTIALEYIPFIILLFSLFVVAGGIRVIGNLVGNPATNTALLGLGTVSASFLGTTGASMLLIRPMIAANSDRHHNIHVFVFFIFLVSNIGGSLTPLGDPPLFLGFLKGVDFLWTMKTMFLPMVVASVLLLAIFFVIDTMAWRKEPPEVTMPSQIPRQVRIEGQSNLFYLAGVIGAVLLSGLWQPGIAIPLGLGIEVPLQGLVRDVLLLVISYCSWKTTRSSIRVENAFTWVPIQEVAILFIAIFVTMIPALAILRAGAEGQLAPLIALVSSDGQPNNAAYFWLTGLLSSFLDNAPTYLVFFNIAGGDATTLMGPLATTLLAISAGAVFMGANTYIGNAPNFMVKSICEERGIRMPSFFGYMVWSCGILLPIFVLITLLFFR